MQRGMKTNAGAALLRRALALQGISGAELARRLGVSASAATQWLTGKTQPEAHRIEEIAKALGIDPGDLDPSADALELPTMLTMDEYKLEAFMTGGDGPDGQGLVIRRGYERAYSVPLESLRD